MQGFVLSFSRGERESRVEGGGSREREERDGRNGEMHKQA